MAHVKRRDSPWAAVAFLLVSGLLLLGSYLVKQDLSGQINREGSRITKVEREVRVVEHRETLLATPCLTGSDRVCRLFIDRLLRAATRKQLRELRGTGHVSVRTLRRLLSSPRVRRKLHVVPLRQSHHHRRARIPMLKRHPPHRRPFGARQPLRRGGGAHGHSGTAPG